MGVVRERQRETATGQSFSALRISDTVEYSKVRSKDSGVRPSEWGIVSWTRSLVGSTSRKGSRGRCCPPAGRRFLGLSFRPNLPSAELEIAEMIGLVSQMTPGLNRVHLARNCLEYREKK